MSEPGLAVQRPVFVYGTLRPGQVNWTQLAPVAARVEPATLPGHRLYALEYPCAVGVGADEHSHGTSVRGELIWIEPVQYDMTMTALDWYEDVRDDDPGNSLYVRIARPAVVDSTGERVECWVYVAGLPLAHRLQPEHEITTGEWLGTAP